MATSHLRVYHGPNDTTSTATECGLENEVSVPLREILSTLADAVQCNRGWLRDFENDDVKISTDLHEVILAYQHYRRPSA
ncbi:MAG: hypothetical protein GY768_07585 [Planctomycetaceae bacterium]|nr:hypothetical protein [Planctomycetaceae bacterium]